MNTLISRVGLECKRWLALSMLVSLLGGGSAHAGELLYNGDMEDGSNGWTMATTGASVMQGWAAKDGTNGMLFGNWFSGASGWLRQTVAASPTNGSVLHFSLDGLCGSEFRSTTRDVYLRLQLLNGGSPVLTVSNNIYAAFTNTTSWNEWSVGYTNSGGLTFNQALVEVGFTGGNGVGGSFRVARWDNASLAQNEPAPTVSKTNVFVLLGQSNMSGWNSFYSYTFYASANVAHPRVKQLSRRDPATQTNNPFVGRLWRDAVDPLTHHDFRRNCTITNEADPYYVYNWMGVGPGKTFGETLANAWTTKEILLVPNAHGGTALRWWQKTNSETLFYTDDITVGDVDGWGNDYGTNLYQSTLDRIRYATNFGTLAGIIWHQGEGDSSDAGAAAAYSNGLNQLIGDLRADLGMPGLPFVVGELGDFFVSSGSGSAAHAGPVQQALQTLPAYQGATDCVLSDELDGQSDQMHFTGTAQREFGRRYGVAMYRLIEPLDMYDDGDILSGHEDCEQITVNVQGDAFAAALDDSQWTLAGLPAGVTVGGVIRQSATSAVVVLNGDASGAYAADLHTARLSVASSEFTSGVSRASALGVSLWKTGVKDTSFDDAVTAWRTEGSCMIASWAGPAANGGMVMPTWVAGSRGRFYQDGRVTPVDGSIYTFSVTGRLGNMRSSSSNIWMKIELKDGTNVVASNERNVYAELLASPWTWMRLAVGVTSTLANVDGVRVSMSYTNSTGSNQSEYDGASLVQSGTPVYTVPAYTVTPADGASSVATQAPVVVVFPQAMRDTNCLPLVSASAGLSNLVTLKVGNAEGYVSTATSLTFTVSAELPPEPVRVTPDGPEFVRLAWTPVGTQQVLVVARSTNAPAAPVSGTVYAFYTVGNATNYSAPVTGAVAMTAYPAGVIIEAAAYTNGNSLGGMSGGSGWSTAWGAGGSYVAAVGSLETPVGYPIGTANKLRLPNLGANGGSARSAG